jgi:hypothetical protein
MSKKSARNLIQFEEMTKEEHIKIASRGGIASGVARRRKRALGEIFDIMLSQPLRDGKMKEKIKKLFPEIMDDELDYQSAMVTAAINRAITHGYPQTIEMIRDTMGEKPIDNKPDISETLGKLNDVLREIGVANIDEKANNREES